MRHILALFAALAALLASPAHAFTSDRISVRVEGSGPDVILVPGLTSQPRVWAATVAAVPGYRYHLVHVSGFAGKAKGGNAEGPVAAPVAEEIARYIREEKLTKPALVGHSMGGTIAMMAAARHPAAVGRLMVVDMVPWIGAFYVSPGTKVEAVRPMADKMLADMKAEDAKARDTRLTAMFAPMTNDAAERTPALADMRASDPDVVNRSFHELMLTDLTPELAAITAPTTVLYVTPAGVPLTDAQIDASYAAAFAPLKGARLIRVPAAAHFIMADNPERFRSELKTFLTAR